MDIEVKLSSITIEDHWNYLKAAIERPYPSLRDIEFEVSTIMTWEPKEGKYNIVLEMQRYPKLKEFLTKHGVYDKYFNPEVKSHTFYFSL